MHKDYNFNPNQYKKELSQLLIALDKLTVVIEKELHSILKQYSKPKGGFFSKPEIINAFSYYCTELYLTTPKAEFIRKLTKKPTRTISGVIPVTVLTKPFPCPGRCIFCPNDVRMPKSYLSDEPGAQRTTRFAFDPYLQTLNRLRAFQANGHSTEKIEVIILGGTWSFYPLEYQIWFIKRIFDALNNFGDKNDNSDSVLIASDFTDLKQELDGSNPKTTYNLVVSRQLVTHQKGRMLNPWEHATWKELEIAQKTNETSICRNVGLVIETRPDHISKAEVKRIRRLGCTKTQIGFQSLNDSVLALNKRGHAVAATRRAMSLLRQAGFKIHAHWMANLYGSSPKLDIKDYQTLFSNPDFKPDELKVYPTSLIKTAELMKYHQQGLWQPYSETELLNVITKCFEITPQYCRLTRVIRDIPSPDIVVGNKKTNFRQMAEIALGKSGGKMVEIRSREIRNQVFKPDEVKLKPICYETSTTKKQFLQYVTPKGFILGFLRLSFPNKPSFIKELTNSAIIREIHVYGTVAGLGEKNVLKAQHMGLGKRLITIAKRKAIKAGFKQLSVISAVGTREYYRNLGFTDGKLYQHLILPPTAVI